jgi:DNA polymerase-3 subunit delta'
MSTGFLPWQLSQAQAWLQQRQRFAHAWLLYGLGGIGKRTFARAAAASLLCEQPQQGLACGQCPACQWVNAGNHPDLRLVRPEALALEEGDPAAIEEASSSTTKKNPSREIRVEQLRELGNWFNNSTHRGGWRVAVIYPAQAMNHVTANALLKVLEEPPEHTVFLMVCDAPDRLLPTLVSRCRRMAITVPDASQALAWLQEQGVEQAQDWLALAGGAPLLAQTLSAQRGKPCPDWLEQLLHRLGDGNGTPAELADQLEKEPAVYWLDMLARLACDLSLANAGLPVRYFVSVQPQLARVAVAASAHSLADIGRWLNQQRLVANHPLNAKMFVHTALERFALACRAA